MADAQTQDRDQRQGQQQESDADRTGGCAHRPTADERATTRNAPAQQAD